MRQSRGFFSSLFGMLTTAGKIFTVVRPVLGIAEDLGVLGAKRAKVSKKWKEQLYSVDLLLDLEVEPRDKYTRLCAHLAEQGRQDDLKALQQFIAAVVEANPTELTAREFMEHLARLVGDTGTEMDFTEALEFLTAGRVAGRPREEMEDDDDVEAVILAKPVDAMTNWFTRDLERRKTKRRGSPATP